MGRWVNAWIVHKCRLNRATKGFSGERTKFFCDPELHLVEKIDFQLIQNNTGNYLTGNSH